MLIGLKQRVRLRAEIVCNKISARSPKIERIVAAGTSNSTPYYSKYSAGFVEERRRDMVYLNLLQLQIPQLVHRECLKSGMEEGNGMQPLEDWNHGLSIDQRPVKSK